MGRFLFLCFVGCLIQLLLLHFTSYASSVFPLCNADDSYALLQIKNSIAVSNSASKYCCSSASNKTATWQIGTNCCQWDGVVCDAMSGHVIGLDLSCSNLQGTLHPNSTLFHLTHLQHLNLAHNNFSHSLLYHGFGDLVSLTHLNLSSLYFVGDIPSTLSHLSKLVSLDLSNTWDLRFEASTWNKLILNATNLEELVLDYVDMSSIREDSLSLLMNLSSSLVSLHLGGTGLQWSSPNSILSLPNLQELSLSGNQGVEGELPVFNWSAPLRLLDLSSTSFSGQIPNSISDLKSLNQLWLSGCQFHGMIPLSLWNLSLLTHLSLTSNRLYGEIPLLLSNLKHLTTLDLKYNNFNGHIPNVFGNITKLEHLEITGNNLEGQLPPSLFELTQLSYIDLSSNNLEGQIPNKITEVSELHVLNLASNLLTGMIPYWCYSLPSLSKLYLDDNKLTGSINEFSVYSIKYLSLSNNNFQGKFPKSIFEFEKLTVLSLSSTHLSGIVDFHRFSRLKQLIFLDLSRNNFLSFNIDDNVDNILPSLEVLYLSSSNITKFPPFLARLQNLRKLDLSKNNIHGKIPKWFDDNLLFSWKNTAYIDLSFNKIQGDLPIPPYGIEFFSVSNNNLTGDISSTLCNASSLWLLNLSHNNFTGMIPQCLGTFPLLRVLDLQTNQFYGSIPDNFSKSKAFEAIKLNGNLLEGPLPQSFGQCTNLEVLDLGGNYIQDIFPSWLETLPELQVLILRANKFHGVITNFSMKHSFPKLRIFDISYNSFSGPLPTSYFKNFQGMMNVNDSQSGSEYMGRYKSYNDSVVVVMKGQSMELVRILTTFTTIDLSNNKFEGEIPQVIGELNSLIGLNLSHNAITGTIPQSLGYLRSLEWLDLSWNQLRGEIPVPLTNLNFLSVLNLSQNQLEGTIPTGQQFNTFQNDSYQGNPMLCGFPLSKSCSPDEKQPPKSTFQLEDRFGFGWKHVAVGYACGMVFGMVLGYYCLFLSWKPLWLARLVGFPERSVKRTNNRVHTNRRRMN